MPRLPNTVPVYRKHKATAQAVCTVRLAGGGYKDIYLGVHLSPSSRAEYQRIVALVSANGGTYPSDALDLTINEAMLRYVLFIDNHYLDADGTPTGTAADVKISLGYLKRLLGPEPVSGFSPSKLKAVRESMIADGRVRTQVNKRVSQVRQFFRWCVEEEIVAPAVLEGLRAVRPLSPGRSGAKEGKAVEPADPAAVEKALPFMSPAVRAVVQLLRLTGARPSEILAALPRSIDRSGVVWVLRPDRHKGSWRGKSRAIHFGPEAQAVLSPWLEGITPDEIIFTPARSETKRIAERSAARQTPRYPSHMKRNAAKRKPNRKRPPVQDRYTFRELGHAVQRACDRAGVTRFTPYSLRHLRAAELRHQFGLEYARAVLGHSFAAMSDHYSKSADDALAAEAAAKIG